MTRKKGFTLVEILIVVVILGILAAIVIPQFTEASTEAKESRLASDLQMLRSQIELYRVQHNDEVPTLNNFVNAMTKCSGAEAEDGDDFIPLAKRNDDNRGQYPYGPYMQAIPTNPFTGSKSLAAAPGPEVGWVYNDVTGEIYPGDEEHYNQYAPEEDQGDGGTGS